MSCSSSSCSRGLVCIFCDCGTSWSYSLIFVTGMQGRQTDFAAWAHNRRVVKITIIYFLFIDQFVEFWLKEVSVSDNSRVSNNGGTKKYKSSQNRQYYRRFIWCHLGILRSNHINDSLLYTLWVFIIETWRVLIADSCTFHLNLTGRNATNHCPRASAGKLLSGT